MQDKTSERAGSHAAVEASKQAPASLRIAVATQDHLRIDRHFGHADAFSIFDVTVLGSSLVEHRNVADHALPGEDTRDTIYRMLADCKLLLVAKIGVTPQEKLASLGIEATDLYAGKAIDAALQEAFATRSNLAAVDTRAFRLLHAMLRVSDLDKAVHFYTELLGMQVLEHREHKKNQFSQVYLGYGAGFGGMVVELVFNWVQDKPYLHGDSFGHIAIEVTDIVGLCAKLSAAGVPLPRPPRAQRHGENTVAFVEDPDGHRIELVQRPEVPAGGAPEVNEVH